MIGSLRGTVLERGTQHVLLEVQGVGYRCAVSPGILAFVKTGEPLFLYIHEVIREDAHDLYGFLTHDELDLCLRLLSVSGVGPKVAMTLLSLGTPEAVRKAIMSGDLDTLTSVAGVGKKTAQKIVLELRGQLVDDGEPEGEDAETLKALQALGYALADARAGLKRVSPDVKGVSDRLRAALQQLSSYGR